MQNRYVGDIGDYVKYALIRHIGKGKRIGIAWYLFPDENNNNDGKFTNYLKYPEKYKVYDPELFSFLKDSVESARKNIKTIEKSGILGDCIFHNDILYTDIPSIKWRDRRKWRNEWFSNVLDTLNGCDIVFADPDNGIYPDEKFRGSRKMDLKRIPEKEVEKLAKSRCAIIYHHNSRFKGGHAEEIKFWKRRISRRLKINNVIALRWKRYNSRTFFIISSDNEIIDKAIFFAKKWDMEIY